MFYKYKNNFRIIKIEKLEFFLIYVLERKFSFYYKQFSI